MITEIARLNIRAGSEAQFERVFAEAIRLPGASQGYVSHELKRCVEIPNVYVLVIQWRTLEDHTVGFRGSPAFAQWRAHIGPFLEAAPSVEHFAPAAAGPAAAASAAGLAGAFTPADAHAEADPDSGGSP